jgi:hypothetical protein
MPRLRPFTPIFTKDLKYGTQARPGILVGEAQVHGTASPGAINVSVALPQATIPFYPTNISGLKFWYDASDTATITDAGSGAVSNWADKSSNNFDLIQTSAGLRPTTGAATLNGLNVITFAGDSMLADVASSNFIFMHDGTEHLVVAVVKFGTGSNPATGYGLMGTNGTASANAGMALYYEDSAGVSDNGLRHHVTRSVGGSHVVRNFSADNAVTPNAWVMITLESDPNLSAAARSAMYVDGGSAIANNADSNAVSTGNPGFQLSIGSCANAV